MKQLQVRRYQRADKKALIALWQQVFPDDPQHNQPQAVLEAKLAVDDLIFIAEYDEQLVGACMAGYDGHRGWLYAVAVSAAYRRLGIGQELVELALAELALLGCIKVNLQIREGNHKVAEFYRALGFDVEPRLSMGRLLIKGNR